LIGTVSSVLPQQQFEPNRQHNEHIPDRREAASQESITAAMGLWIPGSSLRSAPE
jgi:hypothetical protein